MNKLFFLFIFFIYFHSFIHANDELKHFILNKNLHKSHIWNSLLHVRDNKPKIKANNFLLTYNNFSLENELIATIESFQKGQNICKFPARYYWLKNELRDTKFKLPILTCEDDNFQEYLKKTNPSSLELVFVSENITSPSSMMGHVFFKINGYEDSELRQNAVSFFTVIDTVNIPLLITKSTFTGMKGYFILSPYKKQTFRYLNLEQRNIWEYPLKLTTDQMKIIYYHFWELKDVDMKYFFTGFNCATVVDDILSIATNKYKRDDYLWVTPKDVIKKANKYNLLQEMKIIPSIEWKLQMLNDYIDNPKKTKYLISLINLKKFEQLQEQKLSNYEKEYLLTYLQYVYINSNKVSYNEYVKIKDILNTQEDNFIIKKYKNPINTANDSQLSLTYNNDNALTISFLPTANTIYDDNRNYFSESSLKIAQFDLQIKDQIVSLNKFTFYDMQLLLPYTYPTKNYSKNLLISYEDSYQNNNFKKEKSLKIKGGFGITKQIHNDIFVYSLANLSLNINNHTKLLPSLKFGTTIYEIFNMKTVLNYEKYIDSKDNSFQYNELQVNQSIFINKKYRIDLYHNTLDSNRKELHNYGIRFNLFF